MMSRYPWVRAYSGSNHSGLWSPTAAAHRCQSRRLTSPVAVAATVPTREADSASIRLCSCAPLLLIASLCIVVVAVRSRLVLQPRRRYIRPATQCRQHPGPLGEQMQIGLDHIAHAAVQLVRIERDQFRRGRRVHAGNRGLTGGGVALLDPEDRRMGGEAR